MRTRAWVVGPLLVVLSLAGCSSSAAEDELLATEGTDMPRTSTPASTSSRTAAATAKPTSSASTATAEPTPPPAWTAVALWATCQQEWERQHPGISWTGWQAFRSSDASETSDGLHHVARFEKDADGDVVADRDCIIGGTRSAPSVFLDPPLDGFDRSRMPTPSRTFAVH